MAAIRQDKRYFGIFEEGIASVNREFSNNRYGHWDDEQGKYVEPDNPAEEFVKDSEVLFASYEYEDYSGKAFVIFERDGKLFEVHGGHCSCNGLEGQFEPEETTWEALAMRPWVGKDKADDEFDWEFRYSQFEGVEVARDLVLANIGRVNA